MDTKNALRQARELRGWSQAKVAKSINSDIGTVSRWERGISIPSPYFREQLCLIFEMDAQALGFFSITETLKKEDLSLQEMPAISNPHLTQEEAVIDPVIPYPTLTETLLVGRGDLLNHLASSLHAGDVSVLFGLPGVGKTVLVSVLVRHPLIRQNFSGGILWANLGPSPDIQTHLTHWATLLGISPLLIESEQTIENLSHFIHQRFGQRRFLLVIDDVWTTEAAAPFLIGGPNCAQLVTTRFPHIAHVISDNATNAIGVLNKEESLKLLMTMVPDLSYVDNAHINNVIHSTGGLPLTLTLIGIHLQIVAKSGQPRRLLTALRSLTERSARLQLTFPLFPTERLPALTDGMHLSLEMMIASSDQRLSPSAHNALLSISFLPTQPASFSETVALIITNTTIEVLDELLDMGMIESYAPERYTIHQVVADYGRYHGGARLDTRMKLIEYSMRCAELLEEDEKLFDLEYQVILQALEEAYALEQAKAITQITCAIAHFHASRRTYTLAERHLMRAASAITKLNNPQQKASILSVQGEIAMTQKKYPQAYAYYQEALLLARHTKDNVLQSKLRGYQKKIKMISEDYNTDRNV